MMSLDCFLVVPSQCLLTTGYSFFCLESLIYDEVVNSQ